MKVGYFNIIILSLALIRCGSDAPSPDKGSAKKKAEDPAEEQDEEVLDNTLDQETETPPDRTVRLVPDNSFGGYIMNEGEDTCVYTIEFDGICQSAGLLGFPGEDIPYQAFDGAAGRIYGNCDYEGVKVPVEVKFTAGQEFPMIYIADTVQQGLVYTQMVSREVPPEQWPTPEECKKTKPKSKL